MELVIIDYGAGNVQSVQYALNRLGVKATLSNNAEVIQKADKLIFPGVGAAGEAMKALQQNQLDQLIPQLKQPVFGICLGMQLLCSYSQEDNTNCLGIIPVNVQKFQGKEKIPHMGWNNLYNTKSEIFKDFSSAKQVYFVHSYYVPLNEFTIAECDYILPFSAAVQKNNFYACQFHPEKSGDIGESILKNFIDL
jgi:glutamine amidotransferase